MSESETPSCPNCHRSDKVDLVTTVLTDAFPTSFIPNASARELAGKTYYVPNDSRFASYLVPANRLLTKLSATPSNPARPVSRTQLATTVGANLGVGVGITASGLYRKNRFLTVVGVAMTSLATWTVLVGGGLWWSTRRLAGKEAAPIVDESTLAAGTTLEQTFYCYRCDGVFTNSDDFTSVAVLKPYSQWSKKSDE